MIISRTPMRVSFAGGGSDLREYYKHGYGAVLSTAINKHIYITVNRRFHENIRVGYSQIEEAESVHEIKHNIVREAMKLTGVGKATDIYYMSDMLPAHEGSGLGASSSLAVGTLNALYAYTGEHVSAERLAQEACRIEIEILGHPIGKQDQYAAAYGGFNFIRFNDDETVVVTPVIMKPEVKQKLSRRLIFFYTGLGSRSDTILTEQRKHTESNLDTLHRMVELAEDLRDALRAGDLTQFGSILHEGWLYKQRLASNVTNPLIDSYYERGVTAGALGGKLLGSGGGGFLCFYCTEDKQDKVKQALSNLRTVDFSLEPEGSRIIYVSD